MALIPQKLAILRHLKQHVEFINPTNDDPATGEPYAWDLRGKFFIGRKILGQDETGDLIAVNEAPVPEATSFAGEGELNTSGAWRNLIQGFTKYDAENPTEPAYRLMAAVELRLARLVQRLPNNGKYAFPDERFPDRFRVARLSIHRGVVSGPDQKVASTGFFYIPLTITFGSDLTNPYVEEN